LKVVYDVLKNWGFRCPCCMSPIDPNEIVNYEIKPVKKLEPTQGNVEVIIQRLVEKCFIRTDSNVVTCSNCGEVIKPGMLYLVTGKDYICEHCLRNKFSNEIIEKVKKIKTSGKLDQVVKY